MDGDDGVLWAHLVGLALIQGLGLVQRRGPGLRRQSFCITEHFKKMGLGISQGGIGISGFYKEIGPGI